jgi:hypothetical protein
MDTVAMRNVGRQGRGVERYDETRESARRPGSRRTCSLTTASCALRNRSGVEFGLCQVWGFSGWLQVVVVVDEEDVGGRA